MTARVIHAEYAFACRRVEADCERLRQLSNRLIAKLERDVAERRKRIALQLKSIETSAYDFLPADSEPAA